MGKLGNRCSNLSNKLATAGVRLVHSPILEVLFGETHPGTGASLSQACG